jgi:polysaccharide deacetylase 2 family uncharacterized protein YibQ
MAGSSSGKAAYWIGALTGVVCSAALVATLSVLDPSDDGAVRTAAATPEPQPIPTPEPTPQREPEPEPVPALQPEPAPEPAPVPSPEPAPAPTPEPIPTTEPEVEEDTPPANAEGDQAPIVKDGGALVQHGEFFNGDPSEPVLAIVLIGVGADGAPTDDVFLLPAPLTLAIDPALVNAGDLVLYARDSGFEVLTSLTSGPSGSETDAAAAVAAQLSRMNGVIGVAALDGSLVANAAINGVLTAIESRGMVLFDATAEGGSAAFRTAKGMGLFAAPLGRAFDETPSSAMVFQSLERAAFDARRTGAFVVVGRAEPAVLTGVRRWLNVKAGKSVAVAPLSEVIRRVGNQ